nr:membrane protein insertion efficiency factor YidD [Orenia marismortui]
MSKGLIYIIKFYQNYLSPLKSRSTCRFYPSCSTYTIQSLEKYGLLKGGFKAIKRILSCHPFHSGGYDPVD